MLKYLSREKDQGGPNAPLASNRHEQVDTMQPELRRKVELANRRVFGNVSLRSHQIPIIDAVMANRDVFAVLPTGAGKTLCFALPAVLSQGVTVVISPLIALIEDQVQLVGTRDCESF